MAGRQLLRTEPEYAMAVQACGRLRGFSLLEVLVVVFIIGILATMFTLSVGITGGDRELEREVDRLRALIGLASEEAVFQGREIGLKFLPRGYEFSVFDADENAWVVLTGDDLLSPRDLPEELLVELEIDGRAVVLKAGDRQQQSSDDDPDEQYRPQIFIFSSGDVTPFELLLRRPFQSEGLSLEVTGDGSVELMRDAI
jgi:general secretion pathway protein H